MPSRARRPSAGPSGRGRRSGAPRRQRRRAGGRRRGARPASRRSRRRRGTARRRHPGGSGRTRSGASSLIGRRPGAGASSSPAPLLGLEALLLRTRGSASSARASAPPAAPPRAAPRAGRSRAPGCAAWLRSSCATARTTGPARATTRRFWVSVSAVDASTSNTASTRVSDVFACWPPGPLDRETRSSTSVSGRSTDRVTRRWVRSSAAVTAARRGDREQRVGVLVVDLQRRVGDPEALVQHPLDRAADAVAVVAFVHEHVRGEGGEAARDLPDVQVVHLDDAALGGNRPADLLRVHSARGRLEEDERRLAQHAPGADEKVRGRSGRP